MGIEKKWSSILEGSFWWGGDVESYKGEFSIIFLLFKNIYVIVVK